MTEKRNRTELENARGTAGSEQPGRESRKDVYEEMGFPGGTSGKEPTTNAGDAGSIPGLEDPLEEEMATHSSILAGKIPWTEEPSRYSP